MHMLYVCRQLIYKLSMDKAHRYSFLSCFSILMCLYSELELCDHLIILCFSTTILNEGPQFYTTTMQRIYIISNIYTLYSDFWFVGLWFSDSSRHFNDCEVVLKFTSAFQYWSVMLTPSTHLLYIVYLLWENVLHVLIHLWTGC